MLVTIAGPDASGKSTVTFIVKKRLEELGVPTKQVDKWDILDFERHPECRFLKPPLSDLRRCVSEMRVPARTLFLFWTIATTIKRDQFSDLDTVVLDSYWIKHAASESIYGASQTLIDATTSLLPRSDLVFILDIEPEAAWERKARTGFIDVVPYECGMDASLSKESFLSHQGKLRNVLLQWARERGWVVVDGSRTPDEIAHFIASAIREHAHP